MSQVKTSPPQPLVALTGVLNKKGSDEPAAEMHQERPGRVPRCPSHASRMTLQRRDLLGIIEVDDFYRFITVTKLDASARKRRMEQHTRMLLQFSWSTDHQQPIEWHPFQDLR